MMTDDRPRESVEAADGAPDDRLVFELDENAWEQLQEILHRPGARKARLAALMTRPSVLERPS